MMLKGPVMRSVVITGASNGIGWATAKLLLDRGFRVFGSVRKEADAEPLKREFGANFTPLLFDITDEAAVLAAAREVRAALDGETLFGLVNNAGIAIEGLSESLRREMMLFGIDVIVVAPGAVKTPIWSKAEEADISAYKNSPFFPALERIRKFMLQLGESGLPAEKIAERIADALTSASPKVRYQITPDPMRHLMTAVLPKRMVDKIIAKRLGLMPPA